MHISVTVNVSSNVFSISGNKMFYDYEIKRSAELVTKIQTFKHKSFFFSVGGRGGVLYGTS